MAYEGQKGPCIISKDQFIYGVSFRKWILYVVTFESHCKYQSDTHLAEFHQGNVVCQGICIVVGVNLPPANLPLDLPNVIHLRIVVSQNHLEVPGHAVGSCQHPSGMDKLQYNFSLGILN